MQIAFFNTNSDIEFSELYKEKSHILRANIGRFRLGLQVIVVAIDIAAVIAVVSVIAVCIVIDNIGVVNVYNISIGVIFHFHRLHIKLALAF